MILDIFWLIVYLLLLALQIVWLVIAMKKPCIRSFAILYLLEIVSGAGSYLIGRHYDSLPGSGFMPGLTYFAEAILGYGASFVFLGMLGLSLLLGLVRLILLRQSKDEK